MEAVRCLYCGGKPEKGLFMYCSKDHEEKALKLWKERSENNQCVYCAKLLTSKELELWRDPIRCCFECTQHLIDSYNKLIKFDGTLKRWVMGEEDGRL